MLPTPGSLWMSRTRSFIVESWFMGGWVGAEASGLCTCSFDPWRAQENALNGKYLVTWGCQCREVERRKSVSKSILIKQIAIKNENPARYRTHYRSYVLIQRPDCV